MRQWKISFSFPIASTAAFQSVGGDITNFDTPIYYKYKGGEVDYDGVLL